MTICNQIGYQSTVPDLDTVTFMVTRAKAKKRLYLKEHREAKGMSAAKMGEHLGMERESVYRVEREQWRLDPEKQIIYAAALNLEPEDLWNPPLPGGIPPESLDEIVRSASPDVKEMAFDIVRRLVSTKR